MAKKLFDPTAERPYLADANYYRLGYQLAAQLMHREESGQKPPRRGPEEGPEILYGRADTPSPKGPSTYRVQAREQAEGFLADAATTLRWLGQRRAQRKPWQSNALKPTEERLEEFLMRTVEPTLQIIVAASLRSSDPKGAEDHVQTVRQRAARRGEQDVSYRVLYNLACYEAGKVEDDAPLAAVRYLREALRRAPANRRQELGRWATKDPSLETLRKRSDFKEVIGSFG